MHTLAPVSTKVVRLQFNIDRLLDVDEIGRATIDRFERQHGAIQIGAAMIPAKSDRLVASVDHARAGDLGIERHPERGMELHVECAVDPPRLEPGFPEKAAHRVRPDRFRGNAEPVEAVAGYWGNGSIRRRLRQETSAGRARCGIRCDPSNHQTELTDVAAEQDFGRDREIDEATDHIRIQNNPLFTLRHRHREPSVAKATFERDLAVRVVDGEHDRRRLPAGIRKEEPEGVRRPGEAFLNVVETVDRPAGGRSDRMPG